MYYIKESACITKARLYASHIYVIIYIKSVHITNEILYVSQRRCFMNHRDDTASMYHIVHTANMYHLNYTVLMHYIDNKNYERKLEPNSS